MKRGTTEDGERLVPPAAKARPADIDDDDVVPGAAPDAAAGAGGAVDADGDVDLDASPKIPKAAFNDKLLEQYYGRFFPYEHMFRWLSYSNSPDSTSPVVQRDFLKRREFSFTVATDTTDVYMRYLSFADVKEMERGIKRRCPHKIDIGAVFAAPPDKHDALSKDAFYPKERELVFDIDLTDYDCVRTCCTGADICHRCWQYMNVAVKVMDAGLREDFGFEHMLWVYSGRRGIHCWVCDEEARKLTNVERTAIVDYFSVLEGGSEKNSNVQLNLTSPMHPSLQRAFAVLEPFFEDVVIQDHGQRLLSHEAHWPKVLSLLPPALPELRASIEAAWRKSKDTSATCRWRVLQSEVDAYRKKLKATKVAVPNKAAILRALTHVAATIVFTHAYPRLDLNVSKGMNHLLKSPFCVHPKTGRVCVPFDPATVDSFDPAKVPSVEGLLNELDEAGKVHGTDTVLSSPRQYTSMKQPLAVMDAFLKPMEREAKRAQRLAQAADGAVVDITEDW